MTVSVLVLLLQQVFPKLSHPLGSAWLLWQTCQYRSQFSSKIRFDLETKIELALQYCIFRVHGELLCPRLVQNVHCFGFILLFQFLFDLEATYTLGTKIDFLFLLVTEGQRRIVQLRLISNLLRSIVWITSGLLTTSQIFPHIFAIGFPVALHWLAILREEVV